MFHWCCRCILECLPCDMGKVSSSCNQQASDQCSSKSTCRRFSVRNRSWMPRSLHSAELPTENEKHPKRSLDSDQVGYVRQKCDHLSPLGSWQRSKGNRSSVDADELIRLYSQLSQIVQEHSERSQRETRREKENWSVLRHKSDVVVSQKQLREWLQEQIFVPLFPFTLWFQLNSKTRRNQRKQLSSPKKNRNTLLKKKCNRRGTEDRYVPVFHHLRPQKFVSDHDDV